MPNSPGATTRGGWRRRSAELMIGVSTQPRSTDRTARLALIAGATKDPVMLLDLPPRAALLEHESLDGDRLAALLPDRRMGI